MFSLRLLDRFWLSECVVVQNRNHPSAEGAGQLTGKGNYNNSVYKRRGQLLTTLCFPISYTHSYHAN